MKKPLMIALAAVVAMSAFAQKSDPFDYKVADILLLQDRKVQNELGITEKVRNKMNSYADDHQKSLKAYGEELQKKGIPVQKDPNGEARLKALFDRLKSKVFSLLSGGQVKRLREMTLQKTGPAAMMDATVAAKVGLSSKEVSNMKSIFADGQRRMQTLVEQTLGPIKQKYAAKKPNSREEADLIQAQANLEAKQAVDRIKPQGDRIKSETETKLKGAVSSREMATFVNLEGKPSSAIK